jgi:ankyrin repeat protein
MQNRKLGTVMCDAGTFKSDAAINIKNNVVFIDNASLIYAEIHTEFGSNFLEIDNKGEKTLIMRGNKISGLSKDALIKFDNSIMNHLVLPRNPENNEITIPGLLSTNQNNQAMHSFFNRKPSPPALTSDEKNLLKAAFDGEWKDIKELGKTPINLNVMSPEGYTPLYIASQNGHIRAVAELLRLGADVNLTDKDGTSAVWIASHQGYEHIVELLARHHADLNLPSNKATPLEIAIVKSHAKVIHILSHFININDPIKGVSPIYYAIHYDCQNGLEKNNKKEKNDIIY